MGKVTCELPLPGISKSVWAQNDWLPSPSNRLLAFRRFFEQSSKGGEVHRVQFDSISFPFFCFQIHRSIGESGVIDDVSKRFQPQAALAKMLMTIDSASKWLFTVVQMPGADPINSNPLIKLVHCGRILGFGLKRITGGENVT